MAYPLPAFVSRTLADQPDPPRRVPLQSVARAILGGNDGATFAGFGLLSIVFGLAVMAHAMPRPPKPIDLPAGLAFVGLGVWIGLLWAFRIWRVARVLRGGDAHIAEIVEAEVGRARFYGTPWGEWMRSGNRRVWRAVKGSYLVVGTGEVRRFYIQQSWALTLQPGNRIWVLRRNGRDALYAPV
jgi:hypothetical protein